MNKRIKYSLSFLICLLLAGCIQTEEIEKIGVINARGIDLLKEEDALEATLIVFQFSPQSEEFTKLVSGRGKTVDGAVEDAEHSSVYKLAPGKIKLSLYGKDMAEQGLLPLLDGQARDARLPDLMYLAVSETTAKEVLSVDEQEISVDVGQFIHGLIENHSTDHNIPRKTLQDFLRIYYDVGQDNVLPMFKIENDAPKLSQNALFKDDKMIGTINNKEAILINLMDRTVREQMFEVSLPLEPFQKYILSEDKNDNQEKAEIAFIIQKGKSKTKMLDLEKLVFETNTKMNIRLVEQSAGIRLEDPKAVKTLEKEIEKNINDQFHKLLKKLQQLQSDPFGYGRYYKKDPKGKNLTRDEWREKLPNIDVTFNIDLKIIGHGATD